MSLASDRASFAMLFQLMVGSLLFALSLPYSLLNSFFLMFLGLLMMISPLKEKRSTRVASRAAILTGVSTCKNFSLNQSIPLRLIISFLLKYPATRGNPTYKATEKRIVFHGMGMAFTPSRNPPRGA